MSSQILRDKVVEIIKRHGIKAKRYLDLGCGDGTLTAMIAKIVEANEVYGVDIDDMFLQRLPNLIRGIKFDLELLNSTRLPFENNYFDLITTVEVIEHLSCGDYLIMEAFRILKKGGYLLLTTPNLASWINRLLLAFGYQPMFTEPSKYYWIGLPKGIKKKREVSAYGHKNLYTLKAMLDILKAYGLTPCFVSGCRTYEKGLLGVIDRLMCKVSSIAPLLIILAKKLL